MRVVVTGGGSGGHIYPALAIARGLRTVMPDVEILYVGTDHGLEKDLVPRASISFATIHARALLVRGIKGKMLGVFTAVRGLADAIRILRRHRPDVVVGTGGYVSGPVGLAASLLHIPLVIQEQNAWPGLTNRSLSRRAYAVCVPFQEAIPHLHPGAKVVIAGNPISLPDERLSLAQARERLGLKPDLRILMATGGSQGALKVNQLVFDLLSRVREDSSLGLIWATGKRYYADVMERVRIQYGDELDTSRIQIHEYFYQIQTVYQAADLYVGRGGAMTLADCEAFGLPTVIIPSPNVSEDHQSKNAAVIEQRGAGLAMSEDQVGARATDIISLLTNPTRTTEMGNAMRSLFDIDALERIVITIFDAARKSGGKSV